MNENIKQFVPCRKCYGKNGKVLPLGFISKIVKAKDGITDVEVAEECECHKKWTAKIILASKIEKANLSSTILDYNIENYKGTKSLNDLSRLKKYVEILTDKNQSANHRNVLSTSIYIYGPNGTQKTTVASWVAKELLSKGFSVKYMLLNDLIKLMQSAERDEEAKAKVEKILDIDILIIDEAFDKKKVTLYKSAYQLPFIDSFLRNRMQSKNRGIIFISNVKPNEIAENGFDKSIEDLVVRNTNKYVLTFEDNYMDNMSNIDLETLF